ncbi:hypothetical protein [Thermotoga sp. KOL6]|uniref:hypothetical protein n=1 Tax=Thermotoga sp. KOL6 TaxID=126741 RepID=UPI000C757732|nr:hypothetical protein [Thermotoga sp. KOL6]PLV58671.1 hypothetical protein AS005_07230 [Thermotoga sp. KOL6]
MNVLMFFLTMLSAVFYMREDFLFGIFLGVVSLVFLFGAFETSKEKYKAHLFVGSVIVLFFAGMSLLEYSVGFLKPLLGEEKEGLSLGNFILFFEGVVSLFFVFKKRVIG